MTTREQLKKQIDDEVKSYSEKLALEALLVIYFFGGCTGFVVGFFVCNYFIKG